MPAAAAWAATTCIATAAPQRWPPLPAAPPSTTPGSSPRRRTPTRSPPSTLPARPMSRLSTALSVTTQSTTSASWSGGDIGAVTAAGSYTLSGGTFTVNGSGVDIWNTADSFPFVSQALTGDGSITARVVSQTNTNGWAKAGVMFRETLATGATNAFAAMTPSNGVVYQVRPTTGATSSTSPLGRSSATRTGCAWCAPATSSPLTTPPMARPGPPWVRKRSPWPPRSMSVWPSPATTTAS